VENRSNDKAAAGAANAAAQVDRAVYTALADVLIDGAFCARAVTKALAMLKDGRSHPFVTSAFYGVLDNNVRLEKAISCLCEKAPDKKSAVVLKIGIYYCNYADMPHYAAVNRIVDLAKKVGVFSGFVNAVLKKSIGFEPTFASELERFSYLHNAPEWLCKMLVSDYGEVRAAALLDAKIPDKTHIRPIAGRSDIEYFKRKLGNAESSECGCYCDKRDLERLDKSEYAVQSLSSMRAVNAYIKGLSGGDVLDLCAAPGGKSIFLSEAGNFKVTACDIYPHKLELMRGYAKKLGARIKIELNDATVRNEKFVNSYDVVVADCPCSGTGTLKSKPDILIKRKPSDIAGLCELQSKILNVASEYCRVGGVLCYSTCSVLCCENEKIRDKFLQEHGGFEALDTVKLLPDADKCDGFFITRFKKVGKS